MTTSLLRTLAVAALLAVTAPLAAQTPKFGFVPGPKQQGGDIRWTIKEGGRLEFEKDEYAILENDVHVYYQDITVRADKITVNLKTKDVVAEGNVIIDQGPTRVTATQAFYNLETKTGTFFNSTATMDPQMYFSGDKIEKVDDDTFRLTNGIFTSCDLDRPAWSFKVGSAEVTLDDYAHMRDIQMRARNFPIFWTPVLVWPTKRDRSRGFLIPRIIRNSEFGERLELGYFIPFGDSADATIHADVNAEANSGLGTTVRYLPSENVKLGELNAYAIRDAAEKTFQWKYSYKHAQENLPGGFRGVVDIQNYSDLNFFRRYDSDPTLHTLSNIYSSAYLTRNRPRYSLNILADRREIVLGSFEQSYEQLPSLQFRMYPQRVATTPLYFSVESSASHLRTNSTLATQPEADYYRSDFFPTLSLQLRTPSWLSIKPQLSVRETYYSQRLGVDANGAPTNRTLDESLNRFYGQGQVEVVGPSVSRVFNRAVGGFSRFKHVIEPRFRYVYTTNVEEQNEVIRFDTVDSPFLPIVRDSVEYSLTQRLIGKETGENASSREVLSFSLRQTVSLSRPFPTLQGTTVPGLENKFTPLIASLHVNPYQSITLDANATFGNVSHQIDQVSLSGNLVGTGRNADKYLSFSWFSSFLPPGQTVGDSSQFRVNTGSSLWKDRLRADVQVNYDAKERRFLEQRFLLGGTGSCYGVAVEYRRYLVFDGGALKPLTAYGVAVTLKNVGTIGTH